jgi:hypothetical protein
MDPGTLAPLAQLHPDLRFVAPRASRAEALKRTGATNDRLIPVDAGQLIEPWPGLSIVALRAAHETLETDIEGNQRFLGYALTFREEGRDVSIIHSGDTIPFAGQVKNTAAPRPDLLLLPVKWTLGSACRSRHRRQSDARRGGDADRERSAGDDRPSLPAFRLNTLPVADIERRVAEPGLPISSGCHRHVGRGRLRRSSWANIGPNFHTHRRTVS